MPATFSSFTPSAFATPRTRSSPRARAGDSGARARAVRVARPRSCRAHDTAQLSASLLHRAPRRFSVSVTGPIASSSSRDVLEVRRRSRPTAGRSGSRPPRCARTCRARASTRPTRRSRRSRARAPTIARDALLAQAVLQARRPARRRRGGAGPCARRPRRWAAGSPGCTGRICPRAPARPSRGPTRSSPSSTTRNPVLSTAARIWLLVDTAVTARADLGQRRRRRCRRCRRRP